jgi:WD40 repeat protein
LAVSYIPADQVEILDLREKKLIGKVDLPKWGSAVAISPDRSIMAVGGEKLQNVRFPSGEVLAEDAQFGNNIHKVRFTPQGDLLLVSAYDGKARSYALPKDLSTITSLPRPQSLSHLGQAIVYALGLTKDGRMLVTSSGDKTIKIWRR